jgi:hypothetical protein
MQLVCIFLCLFFVFSDVDAPFQTLIPDHRPGNSLPQGIGHKLTAVEIDAIRTGNPVPPYKTIQAAVRLDDGTLWIGSRSGLFTRKPGEPRWRLYHSRRWLPADNVTDVSISKEGVISALTPAGIGRLSPRPETLAAKIEAIETMIRKHHVREGLITSIVVNKPGDIGSGYSQPDNDNDGLWTSLYVAAEAFRYGVTREPAAKEHAWQSLKALMFLEEVTGISGFCARSFLPRSAPKPTGGEWYESKDKKYWWKGDTSSDELVGHYFAYAIYYDIAADPQQKEAIGKVVARITDHIIDHGYYYVGPPGKPTTWGVWAPEKLNRDFRRVGDRGLNSVEILDFLKVAHHITGNAKYAAAAKELIDKYGYAANTIIEKTIWPPTVNHSDDELGFLSYYPLLWYERDPDLRRYYLASIERAWRIEKPEISPLFDYIYASAIQASTWKEPAKRPPQAFVPPARYDHDACVNWFEEVPSDLFEWTVQNINREDLPDHSSSRHRHPTSSIVLPIAERPLMRWNGDPYELNGGNGGRVRDDGSFILLPYWMGRYHRFLK